MINSLPNIGHRPFIGYPGDETGKKDAMVQSVPQTGGMKRRAAGPGLETSLSDRADSKADYREKSIIDSAPGSRTGSLPPGLNESQYRHALEMANLSARVYNNPWDQAWDVLSEKFFKDLDFEGNTKQYEVVDAYHHNSDGFDAALYRNKETDNHVLAFSGTDLFSVSDWLNNATQAAGDFPLISSSQYQKASDLARQLHQQYGEKLEFTGHSLGGGLAQVAALATGRPATCFSAAGITQGTLDKLHIGKEQVEANRHKITHFNVRQDPLSDFDGQMNEYSPFSYTKQYGRQYWLKSSSLPGSNLRGFRTINHLFHTVVDQMNKRAFVES